MSVFTVIGGGMPAAGDFRVIVSGSRARKPGLSPLVDAVIRHGAKLEIPREEFILDRP